MIIFAFVFLKLHNICSPFKDFYSSFNLSTQFLFILPEESGFLNESISRRSASDYDDEYFSRTNLLSNNESHFLIKRNSPQYKSLSFSLKELKTLTILKLRYNKSHLLYDPAIDRFYDPEYQSLLDSIHSITYELQFQGFIVPKSFSLARESNPMVEFELVNPHYFPQNNLNHQSPSPWEISD